MNPSVGKLQAPEVEVPPPTSARQLEPRSLTHRGRLASLQAAVNADPAWRVGSELTLNCKVKKLDLRIQDAPLKKAM